jgi:hypothetical protein
MSLLALLLAAFAAAQDPNNPPPPGIAPRRANPPVIYQMPPGSLELEQRQRWQEFLRRHEEQQARDRAAAAQSVQAVRSGALPPVPPAAYDYYRPPHQGAPDQPAGGRKPAPSLPPEMTEFKDTFAAVVKDFVLTHKEGGAFAIKDDRTGETLRLRLRGVHEDIKRVSPTETFGCADFETVDKPRRTVDLDFYLSKEDWDWSVAKVFVHSVNGRARFAYDDNLRRVPMASVAAAPAAAPKPKAPARLSASASLKTPTEDGLLHGGQSAALAVKVVNAGPGHAYGVKVWLDHRSASGLEAPEESAVGDLAPGESRTVTVPITASEDRPAGKAVLSAGVSEANGFDTEPVQIELETAVFQAPRLELAGLSVSGGSLKPGQAGTVTLTVRNSGRGAAGAVAAAIAVEGGNLFLSGEPSVDLGTLLPGQAKEAVFELVANRRLKSGEQLPAFLTVSESSGRHGLKRQALPLKLGETPAAQIISVSAPAKDAFVSVDAPPKSKTPRHAKSYAVVVGIEKYRDVPGVDFAGRDARTVRDYLVESMGFPAENVALLLDDRASSTDLATYLGPWLTDRARTADSKVFVYYAGHGTAEAKTGETYLVPYEGDPAYPDTKAFAVSRLFDGLAKLPAGDIIVALDSCFSGMGGRSVIAQGTRPLINVKGAPVPDNTVLLSASAANQISASSREARHGLMTYYLLRGLRGEADADGDAKVTTSELYGYLAPRVENDARAQHVEQRPALSPAPDAIGARGSRVWIVSPRP